jgi:hypothetical protein
MNKRMFKNVANQLKIKVDFSETDELIPCTIKFIKSNDKYYAYMIDKDLNKTLIIETDNESKAFKAVLKYLGVKLNHHGDVNKKR